MFFSGKLDDVRVYNRALSPQEIATLYAVGNATLGHSAAPTNSTAAPLSNGLVGYWPLDGSTTSWTSNTTSDLSGNGNTGNLVAMSTSNSPTIGKIGGALNVRNTGSSPTPIVQVPISVRLKQ